MVYAAHTENYNGIPFFQSAKSKKSRGVYLPSYWSNVHYSAELLYTSSVNFSAANYKYNTRNSTKFRTDVLRRFSRLSQHVTTRHNTSQYVTIRHNTSQHVTGPQRIKLLLMVLKYARNVTSDENCA